jgi:hypothetical protein
MAVVAAAGRIGGGVMPALPSRRAAPVHEDYSTLLRVLEASIETLKEENESLKRQLAAHNRCPW